MIGLYSISEPQWKSCHHANWVIVFWGGGDTGDACVPHRMLRWCHCGIDRQWRESQYSCNSGGCPHLTQILCATPPNKHTPIPQFTVCPSCFRWAGHSTPFPSPFPSPFPLRLPDQQPTLSDKQTTLIIPFPIINLLCFHTMGPEESCRQQRKHLLLSRQGTNNRILEPVSYITSVKNTYVCGHTDNYFLLFFLSIAAFPYVPQPCRCSVKFLCQRHVWRQIISDVRDLRVSCWMPRK